MERIIISCPFGNYLTFPHCTSTVGTYTLEPRAGFWKRWWRVLSTVRYIRRPRAWLNRLGLPSPGIDTLSPFRQRDKIISVWGFERDDWLAVTRRAVGLHPLAVELNLSCPNISHRTFIKEIEPAVDLCLKRNTVCIAKLPPVRWMELAVPLYTLGVRWFHGCNTIPTHGGGMGGKPLQQYSLWCLDDLRDRWDYEVHVISGGGVTCEEDVALYFKHGADHVAVASGLFNPFRHGTIKRIALKYKDQETARMTAERHGRTRGTDRMGQL